MNGNLTDGISNSMVWNWDNKVRSASLAGDSVSFKYTPEGAMVYRQEIVNSVTTNRKYIIDPVGKVPTILMELDPDSGNSIEKTYIHAPGQVLAQHNGDSTAARYYYLQDRLGSVRLLIDDQAVIENDYTYDPFGNFGDDFASETSENIENPYRFAGYVWDKLIQEYYCINRWYDPVLARFTGYDPLTGDVKEPMTLHQYLYCLNDPVNRIDPDGEWGITIFGLLVGFTGDMLLKENYDVHWTIPLGFKAIELVSAIRGIILAGNMLSEWMDDPGPIGEYYRGLNEELEDQGVR